MREVVVPLEQMLEEQEDSEEEESVKPRPRSCRKNAAGAGSSIEIVPTFQRREMP